MNSEISHRRSLRYMFLHALREAWRRLPMSNKARRRLKNFLFGKLPFVFSTTRAYRNWEGHNVPVHYGAAGSAFMGDIYVPLLQGRPLASKAVKIICFYLPQFHPIPENDAWWGKNFTEWAHVDPARPQFPGHYQPRVPGELGAYDLRDPAVQRRQIELARLYGVEGFCFYFYWFGGTRLLEKPIENFLGDRSLDFPFCLCWANENWSRRWDGRNSEILIAQKHSPEDDLAFIEHVARYMRDPRYMRVGDKPLLVVYRPDLLPSAKNTARRWRDWCRDNGMGEIYLACTQSFEESDPAHYGFDAAIEFPPNNFAPPDITDEVVPPDTGFDGTVYDWRAFVDRSKNYRQPDYPLFRTVCPGWDNTARRKNKATVFLNNTPALYRQWLGNAIRNALQHHAAPEERLVFVNAWNEWAEGAYLEPDAHTGYAFLQATRDALCDTGARQDQSILLVTHDCHPNGAQLQTLAMARQFKLNGFKVFILALRGGKLHKAFAEAGCFLNAEEAGAKGVDKFLAALRADDTVHAITSTVVSGSILPQLKRHGFRVLSLIHELPGVIRDKKQEVHARTIAASADKVVFPAEMVRRRFCDIAPVDPHKVVIRPQGILRTNPYRNRRKEARRIICDRHRLAADAPIVLGVGYADLRKAPDVFVEIAALVLKQRPDSTFIWVGDADPGMKQKVAARIAGLGLQKRIVFTGFDPEPMIYFAGSSAYALTSREDPFPNVVLESADAGLPVVAFRGASGAEDFIVEQGGQLAEPGDIGDFARRICACLDAPAQTTPREVGGMQPYIIDLLRHLKGAVPAEEDHRPSRQRSG